MYFGVLPFISAFYGELVCLRACIRAFSRLLARFSTFLTSRAYACFFAFERVLLHFKVSKCVLLDRIITFSCIWPCMRAYERLLRRLGILVRLCVYSLLTTFKAFKPLQNLWAAHKRKISTLLCSLLHLS